MKKLFVILSFVALVFASCGSKPVEKVETSSDSVVVAVDSVQTVVSDTIVE